MRIHPHEPLPKLFRTFNDEKAHIQFKHKANTTDTAEGLAVREAILPSSLTDRSFCMFPLMLLLTGGDPSGKGLA